MQSLLQFAERQLDLSPAAHTVAPAQPHGSFLPDLPVVKADLAASALQLLPCMPLAATCLPGEHCLHPAIAGLLLGLLQLALLLLVTH